MQMEKKRSWFRRKKRMEDMAYPEDEGADLDQFQTALEEATNELERDRKAHGGRLPPRPIQQQGKPAKTHPPASGIKEDRVPGNDIDPSSLQGSDDGDEEDGSTAPGDLWEPEEGEEDTDRDSRGGGGKVKRHNPTAALTSTLKQRLKETATEVEEILSDTPVDVFLNSPPGNILCSRIIRDGGTFRMYVDKETGPGRFLIGSEKRTAKSSYRLAHTESNMKSNTFGSVESNFMGTEYTSVSGERQLASVFYDSNVFGSQRPRKLSVAVPKKGSIWEGDDSETLAFAHRKIAKSDEIPHGLHFLRCVEPKYSAEAKGYTINFGGRVTQASVKNFQLFVAAPTPLAPGSPATALPPSPPCPGGEEGPGKVTKLPFAMQFGRISKKEFVMDFAAPLTPVQAFAIAVTAFDSKLASE